MRAKETPGDPPPALTAREVEVLRHLAEGLSTREIADTLYISVATVRTHIQNVLQKLDVHSQAQAVALALRKRLI
jgi:DNA-binding NarL/FixJ family response regulator